MIVIGDGEVLVRQHLARALLAHMQWCRRSGIEPPAELVRLADTVAAPSGQQAPTLVPPGQLGEPAPMAVSVLEAARRLAVSERTIRRRVADGTLPHVKLGRRCLIPAMAIHTYGGGA